MLQSLQALQSFGRQYHWLQQMRSTHPIWLDEASRTWHVFRYEDVKRVLSDYTQFSSKHKLRSNEQRQFLGSSLLMMDPPEHRHYRNLISPFFTPRALSRLSGRITAIVQDLLDRVRATGTMDVVADLAYPLPVTVIAEMLGIPTEDRPLFKDWVDALLTTQSNDAELVQAAGEERFQRRQSVIQEMTDYFIQKLEEHRRHPQTDLLSELLTAEVDGIRLSQEDILSFCRLLLIAGHVSTVGLLGMAILCFDEHLEVMEQLRQHPELMPGAIEEVLRYAFVIRPLTRRTTTQVIISDACIPANSTVLAWIASANHDSSQFPDPDRFDITRSPNRHLSFGHGIHSCIGAPLARLEASIALPMMLEQLPRLQRVPESSVELLESGSFLWVKRLPITFAPTAPG